MALFSGKVIKCSITAAVTSATTPTGMAVTASVPKVAQVAATHTSGGAVREAAAPVVADLVPDQRTYTVARKAALRVLGFEPDFPAS